MMREEDYDRQRRHQWRMQQEPDHQDVGVGSSMLSEVPLENAEAGVSLPSAEEIRMSAGVPTSRVNGDNNQAGFGFKDGRSWKFYLVCSLLALLVVVIGLSVGLSGVDEEEQPEQAVDDGPVVVAREASLDEVIKYLTLYDISDYDDLVSPSRPQGKAAVWIAEQDGMNLAVPPESPESDEGYGYMQRYVMALLYHALIGEQWRFKLNWLEPSHICNWRDFTYTTADGPQSSGVMCDIFTSPWTNNGLYLDNLNAGGSVPTEIGLLTKLEVLDLNFNRDISGELPSEICQLTNLQFFALGFNTIYGPLPDCIGQLTDLRLLFVSDTFLEDEIPTSISDLTNLRELYLDDNDFEGNITTLFNRMSNLEHLYIEDNMFSGHVDENFLPLRNLRYVDMSDNLLEGGFPSHWLENSSSLTLIDLHNNALSGQIRDTIPAETSLEFLALHGNDFDGPIPPSISNLTKLFHLDLSSLRVRGPIPTELGEMVSLEYLFIGNNDYTPGPVPHEFSNLINLAELSLKGTNRNGTLPNFIGKKMKKLTLLDLDNNEFYGPIPESYGNLNKLQFLLLNRNQLNGDIPASFTNLTGLRGLFLERNDFVGDFDTICSLDTFNESEDDADGTEVFVADCGGSVPVLNCTCCTLCCDPTENDLNTTCHDMFQVASLYPAWETLYRRVEYDFVDDNVTRFVDRQFIDEDSPDDS